MAAKLANMVAGDNQHKAGPANLPDHSVSQAKAAEMLNVSERSVRAAAKVLHSGDDELVQAVERGDVAVSAAAWIRVFTYKKAPHHLCYGLTITIIESQQHRPKMINRTKQDWAVGKAVRVGFLTLTVVAAVATPGDFKPDAYVLASKTSFFHFVPHNGLTKIEAYEARELITEGQRIAAQQAAAAIAKASAAASHAATISEMLVGA